MNCEICKTKKAEVNVSEKWHSDHTMVEKEYIACHNCITAKVKEIGQTRGQVKCWDEFNLTSLLN